MFPKSLAYPTSLLTSLQLGIFPYLAYGVFYTWMLFAIWANISVNGIILGSYGFLIFNVLQRELMGHSKTGYSTRNVLRSENNLTRVYREFEILHKYVNSIFEHILLPAHIVCGQVCIACNFMLITGRKYLDGTTVLILVFWSTCALTVWSIILVMGSFVYSHGEEVLSLWKYLDWLVKPG